MNVDLDYAERRRAELRDRAARDRRYRPGFNLRDEIARRDEDERRPEER